MHTSAYLNAEKFRNKYFQDISSKKILDIGSYNLNGTLKPIFQNADYTGLDMEEGPNVDIVSSSHDIPFEDNTFDIVLSSSCFEHDDMFWLSFTEMCRVVKLGGYLYVQAPQNGPYHGCPGDNWRFYEDSWKALEKWGKREGYGIELLESYVDYESAHINSTNGHYQWNDSVGIYKKNSKSENKIQSKISKIYIKDNTVYFSTTEHLKSEIRLTIDGNVCYHNEFECIPNIEYFINTPFISNSNCIFEILNEKINLNSI